MSKEKTTTLDEKEIKSKTQEEKVENEVIVDNDELEIKDITAETENNDADQPMPHVSKPEYKQMGDSKFKTFLKTAFSLNFIPVVLCAIATFFMVFARLFQTILYSNGSQGTQNAYLAFNFIGFVLIAGALITYVINACLKKKIEFGPTLFIVLVCVFAFV